MGETVFYAPNATGSLGYAVAVLKAAGCRFVPAPDRTVTHLLLGVPAAGCDHILPQLPPDVTVMGGKLPPLPGYRVIDLLKDSDFVAENADITARCAISLAAGQLPVTWKGLPVAVVGWGRIGKCLARLLKAMDAAVTVVARKPEARGMLRALGYRTTETLLPEGYRVIFNTADGAALEAPPETLSIDLASRQGLLGAHVIWARGLPGKMAPESAGELIAHTLLQQLQ
ncbi:MAG: hypothetical protein IKU07_05260 [Oscillospiraceae bacterium]|nr:hypothetical protein [Oscillospiraceae bacterium]